MGASLLLFWGTFGCGYHLEEHGPLSGNVSQVFVPVFDNHTIYTYAGILLSNAMIQEIMEQTETKVIKAQESCCRIRGSVKKIGFSPMVRDAHETVCQQKITMWADMELVDPEGNILWEVRDMTASKDYTLLGHRMQRENIQEEEANIRNAVQAIAKKIAQKAVMAMKNDF